MPIPTLTFLLLFFTLCTCRHAAQPASDTKTVATGFDKGAFAAELAKCLAPTSPAPAQKDAAKNLYATFNRDAACAGCHMGDRSYGRPGNFTLETMQAFFDGLAIRAVRTRELVKQCFIDNSGRVATLAALGEGSPELFIKLNIIPARVKTPTGELYWRLPPGLSADQRQLAADRMADALLRGAFEAGAEPGDEIFTAISSWITAGAWLPEESYINALVSLVAVRGYWKPTKRWQPLTFVSDANISK